MNPDYINGSIGGALIALSVVIMMGMLGRVTGISGILWQSFVKEPTDTSYAWRPAFLIGLVLGPILVHTFMSWEYPAAPSENILLIVASGLLVGFGTKLSNGCTSGHGICGIGRFSTRSIIATLIFMATGIITVALKNVFTA
jgi:hypothetical protein